jgi:hypothetical protein
MSIQRVWLGIVPVTLALILCSYTPGWDITIENHRNQPIVVDLFAGAIGKRVPSCTVISFSVAAAPFPRDMDVHVRSETGQLLESMTVRGPRLHIPVRPAVRNECPTSIEPGLILSVWNDTNEDLSIQWRDQHLGVVGARETRSLGPVDEDWTAFQLADVSVRGPSGEDRLQDGDLGIGIAGQGARLGDNPRITVTIRPESPR